MDYLAMGVAVVSSAIGAAGACYGIWVKHHAARENAKLTDLLRKNAGGLSPQARVEIERILTGDVESPVPDETACAHR
jgi:hypothetical protein